MLHLRVISPSRHTDAVLKVLLDHCGVTHIVISRDAALEPEGDSIMADVARESANEILEQIEAIGIKEFGGITLHPLETILSDAAYKAEADAPGEPGDAVVWEELISRTRQDSTLTLTFLAFLTISCLLAAVGVVTDSPVTVVGAMVVGPEFGPLAALAVAVFRRKFNLAKRSAIALLVAFPVAMAVTAAGAWTGEWVGWITLDSIKNVEQVDFIYDVGPFSFVVALLAGAAGMLSLVTSKSAALVGVFISVTTVPAAGFAVVAATVGEWKLAAESSFQLAVNLVGIVIAGVVVLMLRPAQGTEEPFLHRLRHHPFK
jgi:uncharacterized hydrophobic protein (TIGR00271 family)